MPPGFPGHERGAEAAVGNPNLFTTLLEEVIDATLITRIMKLLLSRTLGRGMPNIWMMTRPMT